MRVIKTAGVAVVFMALFTTAVVYAAVVLALDWLFQRIGYPWGARPAPWWWVV